MTAAPPEALTRRFAPLMNRPHLDSQHRLTPDCRNILLSPGPRQAPARVMASMLNQAADRAGYSSDTPWWIAYEPQPDAYFLVVGKVA